MCPIFAHCIASLSSLSVQHQSCKFVWTKIFPKGLGLRPQGEKVRMCVSFPRTGSCGERTKSRRVQHQARLSASATCAVAARIYGQSRPCKMAAVKVSPYLYSSGTTLHRSSLHEVFLIQTTCVIGNNSGVLLFVVFSPRKFRERFYVDILRVAG